MADEPQSKLRGGFVKRTTRPTRLLTPGEQIGSLRVVASPGHSPDHIAFSDERDGTLIAGDAFQTRAGIAVAGVLRWLFPFPALATWHLPTAKIKATHAVTIHALAADVWPWLVQIGQGRGGPSFHRL